MIIELRRKLKKARWIWFFVAAALAAPAGGFFLSFWKKPSDGRSIGSVNDLPLSVSHYQHTMMREQAYRAQLAQYGFGHLAGPIEPANVVRSCAEDALLDSMAENLTISVGDEKLQEALSAGLASQIVRGDGKVDMDAYRQVVAATFRTDIETYEAELKLEMRRNMVREIIKQSAYNPKYLQVFENDQEGGKKQFEILTLSLDHFKKKVEQRETKESELRLFYERNKQSYLTEETRIVRTAHLKTSLFAGAVDVSEYDMSEHYNRYCETRYSTPAQYKVRVIFNNLKKGASAVEADSASGVFDSISKLTRDQKADLRTIAKEEAKKVGLDIKVGVSSVFELGKNTYPKGVEQAIGWLKNTGDISQVVRYDDTLYLVQLESRVASKLKSYESVKAEIRQLLEKRMVGYKIRSEVEKFMRSCYDNPDNFDDFLKEHNLKSISNSYSYSDKELFENRKDGIGQLVKAVFEWNRLVPYAGYVQEEDGYTLFSLDSIEKPKTRPFKEVKAVVKKAYVQAQAKKLQDKTAKKMHEQLLLGKTSLKEAADKENLSLIKTEMVAANHQLKKPFGASELIGRAFYLTDKKHVLKQDGEDSIFLVCLVDYKKGDVKKSLQVSDPLLGIVTLQGFVASMLQTARIEVGPGILGEKAPRLDDDYTDY